MMLAVMMMLPLQVIDLTDGACNITQDIPQGYTDGLKTIRIYPPHETRGGLYLWNRKTISIYGCSKTYLMHELAHYKNNIDGISYRESSTHGPKFDEALSEIKIASTVSNKKK